MIVEQLGRRSRKLPKIFRIHAGRLLGEGLAHYATDREFEEFVLREKGPIRKAKLSQKALTTLRKDRLQFTKWILEWEHWKPRRELAGVQLADVSSVLGRKLSEEPFAPKLQARRVVRKLEPTYRELLHDLRLGFTTWQEFGDFIAGRLGERGSCQVTRGFITGFLDDLGRRGLWKDGEDR